MLLTLLGIILLVGGILVAKYLDGEFSVVMLVSVGIVLIVVGILVPVSGYEDPVLVETEDLFKVYASDNIEIEDSNVYLIKTLITTPSTYVTTSYKYTLIKKDGSLETMEVNGLKDNVTDMIQEIDKPVIEKYQLRAKNKWLSLGIVRLTVDRYIIKVSPDQVRYITSGD